MQEENNQTIIVMELAPHGELHDYVTQKKGLSQDEARKFFRQIVSAVDYCHQVPFSASNFYSSNDNFCIEFCCTSGFKTRKFID